MPAFIIANTLYSPSHIELRQAAVSQLPDKLREQRPCGPQDSPRGRCLFLYTEKRPALTRVTAMQASFSYNLHK